MLFLSCDKKYFLDIFTLRQYDFVAKNDKLFSGHQFRSEKRRKMEIHVLIFINLIDGSLWQCFLSELQ